MRSFSKKLAFVLAAAMVLTGFAPAAQAKAADDFSLNRTSYILYTSTESVNHHGSETLADGLYGNVEEFDFNLKNKPADWKDAYSYKWASSKEDVATVASGGIVTAKSVGKTVISCTITEKATGNVAATLKADVQVKANAADLEIEAADDKEYDGTEVAPGTKIDFNRTMADQDGNWSNIKGKYVTDETRWVVTPADKGVTVDQTNGVVTVGEDADGEYTVYAETYQSSKYTATTATSNKVTFTVSGEKELEIEQTSVKKFTIDLGAAVESIGDVTVTRLYPTAAEVYEYPVSVKSATLNKDDKSKVNVELFNNLADKTNYVVTVAGYEPYTLTAVAGAPDSIVLSAKADSFSPFVEVDGDKTSEIFYTLYCGTVDVSDIYKSKGNLLLNAESFATDGSYFVSGNQIWFSADGLEVKVLAEFQSHEYKDGAPVISITDSATFISKAKDPVVVKKVEAVDITGNWNNPANYVPFDNNVANNYHPLAIKLSYSDGAEPEKIDNTLATKIGGKIKYESVTPEVAIVSGSDVYFFKQGKAKIIVYHVTTDATNKETELPIGSVDVEAKAPKAFAKFDLNTYNLTMGAKTNYDDAELTITAKDNYEGVLAASAYTVEIEGTDNNAKAAKNETGAVVYADGKITLDATKMLAGVTKASNNQEPSTVQLTFKVTVKDASNANNKVEKTFTVLIKKPGNEKAAYVDVVTKGFGVDVARTNANNDTKGPKTASFSVLEMNNGVQTGIKTLEKYNKNDTSNVTVGGYYYTVTRDGQDVTNDVAYADGVVTLNFSKAEKALSGVVKADGSTVTGNEVEYPLKAGNYVFTLYEGIPAGNGAVAVQRRTVAGSVTCNTGRYSFAGKDKDVIANDNPETIRAAFKFNMTNGQNATTPFSVDAVTAGSYVNVKSITFYDDLGGNVYAPYKVDLGVTLKLDPTVQ